MPFFRNATPKGRSEVTSVGIPAGGPAAATSPQSSAAAASLVDAFLAAASRNGTERVLDVAQRIFLETPSGDPKAPVSSDYLQRPWQWLAVVAEEAETSENWLRAGQFGLMCEIWNRVILKDEPRLQFGRIVQAPVDLEMRIYSVAFRSLLRMSSGASIAANWTVGETLDQLSGTLQMLPNIGVAVPDSLRKLASGEPSAVGAVRPAVPVDDSTSDAQSLIDRLGASLAAADAGDAASEAFVRGGAIQMNGGDSAEALACFEEAAGLGHVDAMYDAGCVASELGRQATARHWWEAAAAAGRADAAWNLAVLFLNIRDMGQAAHWYEMAGTLGDANGFAALTQMASDAEDSHAELAWSRRGAEAGHPFCMCRYGLLLLMDDSGGASAARAAIPYLERAGDAGEAQALFLAGMAHLRTGSRFDAKTWLLRAEAAGEQRARQVLDNERL